jgi:DNA-binding NarL/FixJ family response regulator
MITIFIVDADASYLARDLNAIAAKDDNQVEFEAITTPESLFDRLRSATPSLVLLHHHWHGLTISEILSTVATLSKETRVIVFTGQAVNIRELIECVRAGVADYWPERLTLTPEYMFRRILHYCNSGDWTVGALRMPSDTTLKLLFEAEATAQERDTLEDNYRELCARMRDENSLVLQRAIVFGAKLLVSAMILTGCYCAVAWMVPRSVYGPVIVVTVVALFGLLVEGRITEAVVRWRGGSARVKGGAAWTDGKHASGKKRGSAISKT